MNKNDDDDMNIKIQNSGANGSSNTKGSCTDLAYYINHEDKERIEAGKKALPFTTPSGLKVTTQEVIDKVDHNHSHLSAKDDKFYHLIISPSAEEIKAMGETEAQQYNAGQKYIHAISDAYAQNFHREGIESGEDLVMYWKPHFTRGENGELQFHIHGIVSRKSKGIGGKAQKLSPLTNHRNTEDGVVKGGFDRKEFFKKCERLFDKLFRYERSVAETFDYNNAQAHGTAEEKAEQAHLLTEEKGVAIQKAVADGIARRRETVKGQNDVAELAALLGMDGSSLPSGNENNLSNAVALAGFRNDVTRIFGISASMEALNLNLLASGATCRAKMSEDGVEDIVFTKNGKKISAKDILDPAQFRNMLAAWEKFTGKAPAYLVRAQNEARLEAERTKELTGKVSQVTHTLKIRH